MIRARRIPMLVSGSGRIVINSACTDRFAARMLLSDRRENGEAFPGEFIARIPVRLAILHDVSLRRYWRPRF